MIIDLPICYSMRGVLKKARLPRTIWILEMIPVDVKHVAGDEVEYATLIWQGPRGSGTYGQRPVVSGRLLEPISAPHHVTDDNAYWARRQPNYWLSPETLPQALEAFKADRGMIWPSYPIKLDLSGKDGLQPPGQAVFKSIEKDGRDAAIAAATALLKDVAVVDGHLYAPGPDYAWIVEADKETRTVHLWFGPVTGDTALIFAPHRKEAALLFGKTYATALGRSLFDRDGQVSGPEIVWMEDDLERSMRGHAGNASSLLGKATVLSPLLHACYDAFLSVANAERVHRQSAGAFLELIASARAEVKADKALMKTKHGAQLNAELYAAAYRLLALENVKADPSASPTPAEDEMALHLAL